MSRLLGSVRFVSVGRRRKGDDFVYKPQSWVRHAHLPRFMVCLDERNREGKRLKSIHNKHQNPYLNQALEDYLFSLPTQDEFLYFWQNEAAVVFGAYQNPFAEINLPYAWTQNLPIIRRITGGGTVYHDPGNLNYTMILNEEARAVDYAHCLDPMVAALNALGYPIEIKNSCDIYLGDKKISGSAQRRQGKRLLHHGTLLFDCDLGALRRSSNQKVQAYEAKGVKSRPASVTNLSAYKGSRFTNVDDFKKALESQFFGANPEVHSLSEEDWDKIQNLAETRYQAWDWTYGHAPAFRIKNEFAIDGIKWSLAYEAKKGQILKAEIYRQDRFCQEESEKWTGLKLEKTTIEKQIRESFGSKAGLNDVI